MNAAISFRVSGCLLYYLKEEGKSQGVEEENMG
jgi:hypothetical protein